MYNGLIPLKIYHEIEAESSFFCGNVKYNKEKRRRGARSASKMNFLPTNNPVAWMPGYSYVFVPEGKGLSLAAVAKLQFRDSDFLKTHVS
jgi:hypothetical protein